MMTLLDKHCSEKMFSIPSDFVATSSVSVLVEAANVEL